MQYRVTRFGYLTPMSIIMASFSNGPFWPIFRFIFGLFNSTFQEINVKINYLQT